MKKNNKKWSDDFLIGLTPGSDGDLLHLSEGINGEIGFNILDFDIKEENHEEEQ